MFVLMLVKKVLGRFPLDINITWLSRCEGALHKSSKGKRETQLKGN